MKQVANEAKVSTATVSRVLTGSGFVSDEVRARVNEAIQKLHYQPNAVARSLKQDKTHTIGVVIPDISNPFFSVISRGLEDVVRQKGYHLIFCSSDENSAKEEELLQLLWEKRVDAVVLATAGNNEAVINRLCESGLQLLLLDRLLNPGANDGFGDEASRLNLPSVTEDNRQGAYELTRQVLERGHTRIGVINGSLDVSTGRERFAGFTQAVQDSRLQMNDSLVFHGHFSMEDGRRAAQYYMSMEERPTALISFNNMMSFGVLLELTRLGVRLPADVLLASYGEVDAAGLLGEPGLLYVSQTPYEMGECAGMLLLKKLAGSREETVLEEQILFKPEIRQL
jgi:LacI family transcriptional regulator